MHFKYLFLLSIFAFPYAASAQTYSIPQLSNEDLASHLYIYVAPVYPAIAQAAKFEGDEVFSIEIGPDGSVVNEKFISGLLMLKQVTDDALKKWRYQPFHGSDPGTAIPVSGIVVVSFSMKGGPSVHTLHDSEANGTYTTTIAFPPKDHTGEPDAEIASRFDPVWETCSRVVIAHEATQNAADTCKKASSIADEFPADHRYVERRMVYVYTATAFANIRDLQSGLLYADKAVAVVKLGQDGNSGNEAAYSIRGQIRAFLGDLEGGDNDMTTAEEFCRKGNLNAAFKRVFNFMPIF